MDREIEERFANVDRPAMIKKLTEIGATHFGTFVFKVMAFNSPSSDVAMFRVRDEGHKKTLTVKKRNDTEFLTEHETIISDFDATVKILLAVGHTEWYYVEKIREIYYLGATEVVFDHLPGLDPLMEIESPTENELLDVMRQMNLSKEKPFGGNDLYEMHYGIPQKRPLSRLTFSNAEKHFEPYITKNHEKMEMVLASQREMLKSIN